MPNDIRIIPDELANTPRWLVWDRVKKQDGTTAKIPINARTLNPASTSDPQTWSTIHEALEVWTAYAGLGFVFNGDGLVGIDLDGCLDANGTLSPWAKEILDRFSNTYAEVSPSGKGIKMFAHGKLAGVIKKSFADHTGIEAYSTGRYFAVTGQMYGAVESVTDCQSGLNWLAEKYGVEVKRAYVPRPSTPAWAKPVGFGIEDFIRRHSIAVTRKLPYGGDGWKWQLRRCPFDPTHAGTDACLYERADGTKHFRCSHNSCANNRWPEFRNFYEPITALKGVKSWN
jgi:hypothetical protein